MPTAGATRACVGFCLNEGWAYSAPFSTPPGPVGAPVVTPVQDAGRTLCHPVSYTHLRAHETSAHL
eukprot:3913803-Alexandrium_andersonii.AAC.1